MEAWFEQLERKWRMVELKFLADKVKTAYNMLSAMARDVTSKTNTTLKTTIVYQKVTFGKTPILQNKPLICHR
jgi:hypothetical protein